MIPPCLDDDLPSGLPEPLYWWHDTGELLSASLFERGYAQRSDVPVPFLHSWGRWPEPCPGCDYEHCTGWVMGHQWEEAHLEQAARARK
jgi:hypothetical protein